MNSVKLHVTNSLKTISHKLNVSNDAADLLLHMCELVRSQFSHLIPHGDLRRFESRTLLGSLLLNAVLTDEYPGAKAVADFGSGIGFPGLPIALLNPSVRVTIVESNSVKLAAAGAIASSLRINNVDFECRDIRTEKLESEIDVIVGRRVAPIDAFLSTCKVNRPSLGCLYLCGYKSAEMLDSVTRVISLESLAIDGKLPIKGECVAVVHSKDLQNVNHQNRWSNSRHN